MEMLTWQTEGFDLLGGEVNHSLSSYMEGVPEYALALDEIEAHFETSQFIWATLEVRPWPQRIGYRLEVPPNGILAILDGFTWNKRLGLGGQPPESLSRQWKEQADELFPDDMTARENHWRAKFKEYSHEPLPEDWLSLCLELGPDSDNPQYLVRHPLCRDWIQEQID